MALAVPYGVYDLTADAGWVNVGVDHDTSTFAVASIRRWWQARGAADYPGARRLLITADAGGSNSYRYRLWKAELAALAAETGLEITVCHFPPGTSKWNKIEHRLELLGWHAFGEGVEHVRLRATDARAHERGDVAVAAVLAQQVGVPEPRQRLGGHGQRPHCGAAGPTLGPGSR